MDLLERSMIIAVIIVAIFLAVYYVIDLMPQQPVSRSNVIQLITKDILLSYPGAVVNATDATQTGPNSWNVTMSVILNSTSPCPTYHIYTYEYPSYHFVEDTEDTYTSNCTVHGSVINYPTAIVKSYNLGISNVRNYIQKYGYNSVYVTAAFYNRTSIMNMTYDDIWLVNYSAAAANYSTYVAITQYDGAPVAAYNMSR